MSRKSKAPEKNALPNLETSIEEINALISQMESGELSLEQALDKFERGIQLIKHSQKILQEAESKVQILIQQGNQSALHPYDENNDE